MIILVPAQGCGESDEVRQAWTQARQEAWTSGATAEEIHQAAWNAAFIAAQSENGEGIDESAAKQLVCIGVHAGISAGLPHCSVVDHTATLASDLEEVDDESVSEWAKEAIKNVYSDWWTSYEDICPSVEGKFPKPTNTHLETYPCGETEEVHQAWDEALYQARQDLSNDRFAIFNAAMNAAVNAQEEVNTDPLMCIGIHLGYTTGMTHCEIFENTVSAVVAQGSSEADAQAKADQLLHEMWSWYSTYAEMCPVSR